MRYSLISKLSHFAVESAAGEGRIVNGEVKFIDNNSGHYKPSGYSAKDAAETAFRNAGFKVPNSAYNEIKF